MGSAGVRPDLSDSRASNQTSKWVGGSGSVSQAPHCMSSERRLGGRVHLGMIVQSSTARIVCCMGKIKKRKSEAFRLQIQFSVLDPNQSQSRLGSLTVRDSSTYSTFPLLVAIPESTARER